MGSQLGMLGNLGTRQRLQSPTFKGAQLTTPQAGHSSSSQTLFTVVPEGSLPHNAQVSRPLEPSLAKENVLRQAALSVQYSRPSLSFC